jgi:hypothetical protein
VRIRVNLPNRDYNLKPHEKRGVAIEIRACTRPKPRTTYKVLSVRPFESVMGQSAMLMAKETKADLFVYAYPV